MVTCPNKEYGCKAESMLRRDLLAHKKENIVEHQDMSLVQMSRSQFEIQQLKEENVRMKIEQNEMNIIKFKVMSMKQLDGVEWDIKNLEKLKADEEMEGPTFYVNNYKLGIYFISRGFWDYLNFYLRRIEGKFDRNLGLAYITYYRVVNANEKNLNESECKEGIMNYQLKLWTKSEVIKSYIIYKYPPSNSLRFYFDVNSNFVKRY